MFRYILIGLGLYLISKTTNQILKSIDFGFGGLRISKGKLYISLQVDNQSAQPISLEAINADLRLNSINLGQIISTGEMINIAPIGRTSIEFLVRSGSFVNIISSIYAILADRRVGRLFVDGRALFNFGQVPFSFSYDVDENFNFLKLSKKKIG